MQAQQEAIKTGKKNPLLKKGSLFAWVATKETIEKSGDYNLSGERYRIGDSVLGKKWQAAEIGKLADVFIDGDWVESKDQAASGIRLIQTGNIGIGEYLDKTGRARFVSNEKFEKLNCTEVLEGDVLISRLPDPVGRACLVPQMDTKKITSVDCTIVRFDKNKILPKFFIFLTLTDQYYQQINQYLTGASRRRISRSNLAKVEIPLPPLPIQQQIVAEIEENEKEVVRLKAEMENRGQKIKSKIAEVWGE